MIKFLGGIALLLSMITSAIAVQPLSVSGKRILASGQQASFSGPSLFWSNVAWGGEKFYNSDAIRWIKNDWKATIVRAAMGVEEGGGYIGSPDFNKAKVKMVVDAAIANDMYVIIDWHSHRAHDYRDAAVAFFQEMARTYGHHPNVIYEIYNEPLAFSWSNVIKPYAEAVAGAIRAIDPDNLIIVGTPNWSQDVDQASLDPITRYPNIAYTLHFYAGTHQQFLRDKAQAALNRNIALFVTEWGSVNASGDGGVNAAETWKWVDFMKTNHISNANWALNDKAEGASALVPGAITNGGWGDGQLTPSGKLAREITRGWPANGGPPSPPPPTPTIPTPPPSPTTENTIQIQAENYLYMQGVQIEDTSDVGGGKNVGYIDTGDWMSYPEVTIPSTGTYRVEYRVASGSSGGGSLQLEKAGGTQVYGTVNIPNTGGWQIWQTVSHTVTLNAGPIAFGIKAIGGGWNINKFTLTMTSLPTPKPTTRKPTQMPTNEPTTESPTTESPSIVVPITAKPTTRKPTTRTPSTRKPTTRKPTTRKPSTRKPTKIPTYEPTTESPTTNSPTTESPTTNSPTTESPTTAQPTAKPTTPKPTTRKPSTRKPSTRKPTTSKPIL